MIPFNNAIKLIDMITRIYLIDANFKWNCSEIIKINTALNGYIEKKMKIKVNNIL